MWLFSLNSQSESEQHTKVAMFCTLQHKRNSNVAPTKPFLQSWVAIVNPLCKHEAVALKHIFELVFVASTYQLDSISDL